MRLQQGPRCEHHQKLSGHWSRRKQRGDCQPVLLRDILDWQEVFLELDAVHTAMTLVEVK